MDFSSLLLNLILSLNQNDLKQTKNIVSQINDYTMQQINNGILLANIESIQYSDIVHTPDDLKNINESRFYAIQNLYFLNPETAEAFWNFEYRILLQQYRSNNITNLEIETIIKKYLNDKNSVIYQKRFIGLIRLSLAIMDFDLMNEIKSIMLIKG